MINSVAELLRELQAKEAAKLDSEKITHAPTIGAMYEGLTRDILDRVIPVGLELSVVDGFAEGPDNKLSPQLDAMLVVGKGRQIPHTGSYVWPIKNVLAVLEVKKNLYGADLDDAFKKMRAVNELCGAYMQTGVDKFDITPARRAFARLTGHYPRDKSDVEALPEELCFLYHALVVEQLSPVRIIFGYEGYVDEASLRKGLSDYLLANLKTPKGFGVTSIPTLIVCRNNSLLKLNGQPYISPLIDEWWPALASNNENPIRLLVELIWTRLSNQFDIILPGDDTLQVERLAAFLLAKLARQGKLLGWQYREEVIGRQELQNTGPVTWGPNNVSQSEWVTIMQLVRDGELDVRDNSFRESVLKEGGDPDALIAGLVEKRILAWRDAHYVRLISAAPVLTTFTPDGQTAVSSGDHDLHGLWLAEELERTRKSRPTE